MYDYAYLFKCVIQMSSIVVCSMALVNATQPSLPSTSSSHNVEVEYLLVRMLANFACGNFLLLFCSCCLERILPAKNFPAFVCLVEICEFFNSLQTFSLVHVHYLYCIPLVKHILTIEKYSCMVCFTV